MDPRMMPKGGSQEYNYDENSGGPGRANEPGVYFHPQAEKFIETGGTPRSDGSVAYSTDVGRVQGDAFTQMGYRPASAEEAKEYRAQQAARAEERRKKETATTVSMSGSAKQWLKETFVMEDKFEVILVHPNGSKVVATHPQQVAAFKQQGFVEVADEQPAKEGKGVR